MFMNSSYAVRLPMLVYGSKPFHNGLLSYYNYILIQQDNLICFENSSMLGIELIFI